MIKDIYEETYDIGDEVVLIVDHPDGNDDLYIGDKGIVCYVDTNDETAYDIGVDFGREIDNGHDCFGTCGDSNGWLVCKEQVAHSYSITDNEEILPHEDEQIKSFLEVCV